MTVSFRYRLKKRMKKRIVLPMPEALADDFHFVSKKKAVNSSLDHADDGNVGVVAQPTERKLRKRQS